MIFINMEIITYYFVSAGDRMKFPTTPPARKKHNTNLQSSALLPDSHPLTKSKSHESQLANKVDSENNSTRSVNNNYCFCFSFS